MVYFTALFPYLLLFILLVRGLTLPGAMKGIKYYITPNISRLTDSRVRRYEGTLLSLSGVIIKSFRYLSGLAGRGFSDLLLVWPWSGFADRTRQLQPVPQQRLQVSYAVIWNRQHLGNLRWESFWIHLTFLLPSDRHAILVSCINSSTSMFAGFVVFSVVGFMSVQQNVPVDEVALSGDDDYLILYVRN